MGIVLARILDGLQAHRDHKLHFEAACELRHETDSGDTKHLHGKWRPAFPGAFAPRLQQMQNINAKQKKGELAEKGDRWLNFTLPEERVKGIFLARSFYASRCCTPDLNV